MTPCQMSNKVKILKLFYLGMRIKYSEITIVSIFQIFRDADLVPPDNGDREEYFKPGNILQTELK